MYNKGTRVFSVHKNRFEGTGNLPIKIARQICARFHTNNRIYRIHFSLFLLNKSNLFILCFSVVWFYTRARTHQPSTPSTHFIYYCGLFTSIFASFSSSWGLISTNLLFIKFLNVCVWVWVWVWVWACHWATSVRFAGWLAITLFEMHNSILLISSICHFLQFHRSNVKYQVNSFYSIEIMRKMYLAKSRLFSRKNEKGCKFQA